MRQFLLPGGFSGEPELRISGKQHHYLADVLRLEEGDVFPGIDSSGNRYRLTMRRKDADSCLIAVEAGEDQAETTPACRIRLFQALLKGKKMDQVIRQAVEAGVEEIVPMETKNAVAANPSELGRAGKTGRWERIVKEALQQSGSQTVTRLQTPAGFQAVMKGLEREQEGTGRPDQNSPDPAPHRTPPLSLVCTTQISGQGLAPQPLHRYLSEVSGERVNIFIGPEGGFDPAELEEFQRLGVRSVSLGPTILRAESAAPAAIAAVRIILLERQSWEPKNYY